MRSISPLAFPRRHLRRRLPAPPGSGITPLVGANLAGLVYYIAPNQLVNMVQQGYPNFVVSVFPGTDPDPACAMDANGWPTEDCRVRPHNLQQSSVQQDCLGSFTGWADSITLSINENSRYSIINKAYDAPTNTTTFTLRAAASTDGPNVDNYNLRFDGTRRTGGSGGTINTGFTNLVIAHPGYTVAQAASKVWTDEAVTYYQRYRGPLRMMDVQETNHSDLTSWSQVKRRATHHCSPTYEDMIDLCNKTMRPLHMQIMHLFDNPSIEAQADLVEANLHSSLYVLVALSNEMWNSQFTQFHDILKIACVELKAFVGGEGNRAFTATRAANVVTVTTVDDHLYTSGQTVYFTSLDGMGSGIAQTVTVTGAKTFTFSRTGADGAITVNTGHWFIGELNSTLRYGNTVAADPQLSIYLLANRWKMRRLKEISDLIRARPSIGDAKMGTRWRVVWEDQMSADPDNPFGDQPLDYLQNKWTARAVDVYLWGWDGAPYIFPHPYIETTGKTQAELTARFNLLLGQNGSDARAFYHIEQRKAKALTYGSGNLQVGCYEGGPDTKSFTLNGADLVTRNATQFNAGMQQPCEDLLRTCFMAGYHHFNWYTAGFLNATDTSRDAVWGVTDRLTNLSTPKLLAIDAVQTNGVTPTRNTVPGTLDGRTCFVDDFSGTTYQNLQSSLTGKERILVYCTADVSTVRIRYTCNAASRAANIFVDRTAAPANPYAFTNQGTGVAHDTLRSSPGPAQLADIPVSWTAGTWHQIEFRRTTTQGDDVQIFSVQLL